MHRPTRRSAATRKRSERSSTASGGRSSRSIANRASSGSSARSIWRPGIGREPLGALATRPPGAPAYRAMRRKSPKPSPRHAKKAAPITSRAAGKLSYSLANQMVQIAMMLIEPRRGYVMVDDVMAEIKLEATKRRYAQRYLAGLRIGTFNGDFHASVLRLEDKNGEEITVDEDAGLAGISETRIARGKLVTRQGDEIADTPIGDLLTIYMSYAVLRYLDGIISRDEISKLWRVLAEKAGPQQSLMMTSFEQKFFSVPYAPKDYSKPELQEILAVVLDALLRQYVLQFRYYGLKGEGKDHRFEPYTLAMYKGGLYLLGKSDRHDDGLIYLAVERIDSVEKLVANGEPVAFRPPPG